MENLKPDGRGVPEPSDCPSIPELGAVPIQQTNGRIPPRSIQLIQGATSKSVHILPSTRSSVLLQGVRYPTHRFVNPVDGIMDFEPQAQRTQVVSRTSPSRCSSPTSTSTPITSSSRAAEVEPDIDKRLLTKLCPFPADMAKDWHTDACVTYENRRKKIHIIIRALTSGMPWKVETYLLEKMNPVINYAKTMEFRAFRNSATAEDYYRKLAESISSVKLTLQEKVRSRTMEWEQVPPNQNQADSRSLFAVSSAEIQVPILSSTTNSSNTSNRPHHRNFPDEPDQFLRGEPRYPFGSGDHVVPKRPAVTSTQDSEADNVNSKRMRLNGSLLIGILDAPSASCSAAVSSTRVINEGAISEAVSSSLSTSTSEEFESSQVDSTSCTLPSTSPEIKSTDSIPRPLPIVSKNPMVQPARLLSMLRPLMLMLCQNEAAYPFKEPVDAELLGIPDYHQIVTTPMDLGTIQNKLTSCLYTEPWDFIHDVYTIFDNAWLYNKKSSKTFLSASKLAEVFNRTMQPLMKTLGYCCGIRHSFYPSTLPCVGKELCYVGRNAKSFVYKDVTDGYYCCEKCFNGNRGKSFTFQDAKTNTTITVLKRDFIPEMNDKASIEVMVQCTDCGRKYHDRCVLHLDSIWPAGFVCDNCLKANKTTRIPNKFTAANLPVTELGTFIENRVNAFLKQTESGASEVIVRVVAAAEKTVTIQPRMNSEYVASGKVKPPFPYRLKTIYAYQDQSCFFGMQVQEYGSECPSPNTRRVYIAYLDSVHFFSPREFRTSVYFEILLGYLKFVKDLGFTTAHLWACPPPEGTDYIFYCHPPAQKFPKRERLQDWYTRLLEKGKEEGIVLNFRDILEYSGEEKVLFCTELPYFEGDNWPQVIEDSIEEFQNDEEEKKRPANKHKNKRSPTGKNNILPLLDGDEISLKVLKTMQKCKQQFFTIRLYSPEAASLLGPIVDPDPLMECELMNGRDKFLTLAREKHLEFSSIRRAKYSTLVMLYVLHNPEDEDTRDYCTCNSCHVQMDPINIGFHCSVCSDFDLCTACFQAKGHQHPGVEENGTLEIRKDLNDIVIGHSFSCREQNCSFPTCSHYKGLKDHIKKCKNRTTGKCVVCIQFIYCLAYHAKVCVAEPCPIPTCQRLKAQLRRKAESEPIQLNPLHQRIPMRGMDG